MIAQNMSRRISRVRGKVPLDTIQKIRNMTSIIAQKKEKLSKIVSNSQSFKDNKASVFFEKRRKGQRTKTRNLKPIRLFSPQKIENSKRYSPAFSLIELTDLLRKLYELIQKVHYYLLSGNTNEHSLGL